MRIMPVCCVMLKGEHAGTLEEKGYYMLAKSKDIKVQEHIVEAIDRIYKNCYYCDVKNDSYEIYTDESLGGLSRKGCYSCLVEEEVSNFVCVEDRERVAKELSLGYIKENLSVDNLMYSIVCRGSKTGQFCRCSILFLNADADRKLEHFALTLECGDEKSIVRMSQERRRNFYEEMRRAIIYEDLYRDAIMRTGIAVYEINVSQDRIDEEFYQVYNEQKIPVLPIVGLKAPCSYEEYCRRWSARVSTDTIKTYHQLDTCEELLKQFREGYRELSTRYRSRDALGRDISLQKSFLLREDVRTGDVMALCYLNLVNHGINDRIDEVTGLPNNDSYCKMLDRRLANEEKMSIIKFGIESFSNINVMYGFNNGNQIIRMFAEELRKISEKRFELYRLPGMKFACCMGLVEQKELQEIYAEIQEVASEKIMLNGTRIPLKVYGGAVIVDGFKDGVDALRSIGTYTITKSKMERRGELVCFNSLRDSAIDLELLGSIHRSISEGCRGFYLCYQPIADTATEEIVGMEALLRWKGEPYGNVPPNKFIPWIESDPIFYELGNWILERAMLDAMTIKKDYPKFILNVNVTALQIEHKGFCEKVMELLEKTGFPAEDLCLELTERCREMDFGVLKGRMKNLQDSGIKIAMDDFGTGNASLSLLKELPVDELKVDMSFIRGIMSEPVHQALVRGILQCANELGLKSCLEGVENEELITYLRQFCATYYQGYYYSKPVEIEEFRKLLK